MIDAVWGSVGLSVAIGGWYIMHFPVLAAGDGRISVSQAQALCHSPVGQLAALSSSVSDDCGEANIAWWALLLIVLGGLALTAWAVRGLVRTITSGEEEW